MDKQELKEFMELVCDKHSLTLFHMLLAHFDANIEYVLNYPHSNMVFMITNEHYEGVSAYSIRFVSYDGTIGILSEFMQYATLTKAKEALSVYT